MGAEEAEGQRIILQEDDEGVDTQERVIVMTKKLMPHYSIGVDMSAVAGDGSERGFGGGAIFCGQIAFSRNTILNFIENKYTLDFSP